MNGAHRLAMMAAVAALIGPLAGCPSREVKKVEGGPPPVPDFVVPAERWVDASAPEGGEGTEARPFRALGAALAPERAGVPVRVHVRTGLYRGPFELPAKWEIEGPESAVLFVEGAGGAVLAVADGRVAGVSLQGGAVGLAASGPVRAEGIHCSGQRQAAVEVRGGSLELSGADVRASVSEILGVNVIQGRARVQDSAFTGPFRRAVKAEGAAVEVTVERTRFVEAVTAVQLVGVNGHLLGLSVRGGRGPAVFVGGGEVVVEGLEVDGQEYALLAREARLHARRITSRGAEQGGVALVKSRSALADLTVSGSGPVGAVEVVGGELDLQRFRIQRAASYGVHARSARVAISDGTIEEVTSDRDGTLGDGVHLRDAKGRVERVTVRGAGGSGLLVAEGSDIHGTELALERCRWGGVVVETLSSFFGRTIAVRDGGGAALAVPTEAGASVTGLTSVRNQEGAVWAECSEGARVTLKGLTDDAPRPRPRCVHLEP
ncbi:MAG TPA: hypothetical protein VIG99_02985 [Myxococcaceae bacterium]